MLHTVVTKINYDSIIEIGRYLRKYKIEKWQLYPVNYSEKCKDFFDEIKVSDEELEKLEKELNQELEKEMLIRVYRNQVDFRAKGVIFANSIGEFWIPLPAQRIFFLVFVWRHTKSIRRCTISWQK